MMPRSNILATAFFIVILVVATTAPVAAGTLRDPLPQVLEKADPHDLIPVSIVLKEQVNPREVELLAERAKSKDERRGLITSRFRGIAQQSQHGILVTLRSEQAAGRVGARLRPLWIGNIIGADATRDVIRRIAALPEVDHVNYNPKTDVFLGGPKDQCVDLPAARFPSSLAPAATTDSASPCPSGNEIECGVSKTRAPEVWTDFGYTGQGIKVALIDTGVCYTHPDINQQIWVNPGEDLDHDGVVMDLGDQDGQDNDGNGFVDDLIGWNFDFNTNDPNDDNSHGSHCAGTIAGDGTSGTCTGMAPDAKVMVIKVGVTFADEVDVWNGMQYAADNGADLISMSLGWPHNQNPDRSTWRLNCDNTIAAGTTMIVAAGNEGLGNEPDNVRTPGDVPAVIAIGATDCADNAASFSSRGPVTWQSVPPYNDYPYPPGLTKPEVSAPGVDTKSDNFCSGYSLKSGTSMATPHTAGASALILQADPSLSRNDLDQSIENTAVDLGDSGKDNTFGAGRIDVWEAVNSVSGKIRYESHRIDDSNPDYGNNDGGLDVGETIILPVTLRNRNNSTATGIHGFLTTTSPGVTILNGYAAWAAIAANGTAESSAHFSFKTTASCGTRIDLRLEVRADGYDPSISNFTIRVGSPQNQTFFNDDLETNTGWTASGNASRGFWVREDPHGTTYNGTPAQPEDDTTPTPGVNCWVTGNPVLSGSQTAKDGDVDGGTVTLTSPTIDASSADTLNLDLDRWFRLDPASYDSSSMTISISNDNGATWSVMETLTASQASWTARTYNVASFVPATNQMRVRVQASESHTFPVIGADSLVEALIDDVKMSGSRIVCDSFTPPSLQAPNPVGGTVRAAKSTAHVMLTWTAPPTDGSHGRATIYHVYRSDTPNGTFAEIGTPTSPLYVDKDAALAPPNGHYKVRAENSGGLSNE